MKVTPDEFELLTYFRQLQWRDQQKVIGYTQTKLEMYQEQEAEAQARRSSIKLSEKKNTATTRDAKRTTDTRSI